ncbi:DUF3624 domain-containing protein [Shewanella litorisediminis]|uniref:DUF3624 domain-containing protein n=1 Tax=Shewanella litorisediminis TaxID=1173586 RepID=A0ABX7G276_9GAMM|nr:DUF3624 domain-containing protein [Shewanella litorisediminis]MCL2918495.1 DUF3624 domain-containing protein [Shewanella litorisediminis]QRH01327.1 DUF3624 domain-containing protein [Shewanella litorisediminis]
MACEDCISSVFRQKIGRCKRCMLMLTGLCMLGWPLWYLLFWDSITSVESLTLLAFCIAWTGLLALHLVVWAWRTLSGRD